MPPTRRPVRSALVLMAYCVLALGWLIAGSCAAEDAAPVGAAAVPALNDSGPAPRAQQLATLQRDWAALRNRIPADAPANRNPAEPQAIVQQARLVRQLETLQRINLKRRSLEWPERLAARYPAEIDQINAALSTWCGGHCGIGSHACFQLRERAEQLREKLAADLRQHQPFSAEEHVAFSRMLRGLAELADDQPDQLVAELRQLQVLVAQRK